MKKILSVLIVCLITLMIFSIVPVSADVPDTSATLHTEGNQLVNELGQSVRLIGFNVPYMGWNDNAEKEVMRAVDIALDDWGSNAVRLPINPEHWFGGNKDRYRALCDKVVDYISAQGKYIIIDNHSFYLPDDDDIKFWDDAAKRYKDHPYVIFELFNEPAMCTWQQYYEGGSLTYQGENDWGQIDDITINSCGMPKLLETVRATGAKNICILPGINWSFDLSFCTEENFREFAKSLAETARTNDVDGFVEEYVSKYFMKETTGNGIMYSTHPYPTKPSDWDTYLKDTALAYPILVGECGPTEKADGFVRNLTDNDKSYLDTLVEYVDRYGMNITPWAWGAWPYLNQEPSEKLSAYGSYMKKYFEKSNAEKAITLYDELDYSGNSFTMEAGKYTKTQLSEMGFELKNLKSTAAKADAYQYTVTLYSKEDYSGKSYKFVPDATNVSMDICGFEPASMVIERSIPVNVIPGNAKVTASGSADNQVAENVIDGRNGTFWKCTDKKPGEIVISLDKVYALNRLTIAHASEASMMSVYNASDYTVSISTDGKTFTRIVDVTDNALGLCEYSFEQVLASYIKINITKGSIIDNSAYYLAEVMAYGTEYNGSTEGMDITINSYGKDDTLAKEDKAAPVLQIVLICVFGVIILASAAIIIILTSKKNKRA